MARIFLCYRRDDSGGYAGRLYDRLSQHFGRDNLFMDIEIDPGLDFVEAIQDAVGSCDVLLAVIGRQWLTSTDPRGDRRLDNPEDFVRLEITTALERRIRVIPVLVGGASMPRSTELPNVLQPLARRQALTVGDHFHRDVDLLVAALETVLGIALLPPEEKLSGIPELVAIRRQMLEANSVWELREALYSIEKFLERHPNYPEARLLKDQLNKAIRHELPALALSREEAPTTTNSIGMEFVLIPAGTFMMGSTEGIDDERPVHHVQISQPFYLGKYEVIQSQWEAVMGDNPSRFKGNPKQPVENVSWEDVQEFIRKLNREGGEQYRLPTEAEWEYACRTGSTGAYCFGNNSDQLAQYAWYEANSGGQTQPVGQLKPNAWGLHDMHGNVYEWVQDWYGKYQEAVIDPQGPARPTLAPDRVNRGGSWDHDAWGCRSARRGRLTPDSRRDNLGFRLLRTAQ